jgi:hypothetical protein
MKSFKNIVEGDRYGDSFLADRVKKDWEKTAKEKLDIEEIKGTVYAYGSELATLRLFKSMYKAGDKVKADYSKNLKTFYFRLET